MFDGLDSNDVQLVNTYPFEQRARVAAALRERRRRTAAKSKGRWGQGLEGQRIPGHRVVITSGRRGAKKHTFELVLDDEAQSASPLHWERVTETFPDHSGPTYAMASLTEPLPAKVPLGKSVDIRATMLAVILDALVSAARHDVDLDDVKVVVSQLGSCITQLELLSGSDRRRAEDAVHTEILRRCTKL